MPSDMNTTSDVVAALAADPDVQAAKRAEQAETERLQRLLDERDTLNEKLLAIPANPDTRKKRADLRTMITEVEVEIPAARHEVALKHRDTQRAERAAANDVGVRITEAAASLGATIFTIATDLVGEFRELQALDGQSHTARSVVNATDRALGEETGPLPGVAFASRIDPVTWSALIELAHAVTAERARRERLATTEGATV